MANKKLEILIIGSSDSSGGAASVGWSIGNEMIKRGHNIKYIVGYKKSNKKNVYELNKPLILKWLDKNTKYDFTSTFRHLKTYLLANNIDFGAKKEILDHPWYKKAEIVHFHNLHSNFFKMSTLAQIAKEKKVVWTLHDMSAVTGKCTYSQNHLNWSDGYHPCKSLNSQPAMLWDNTKYLWEKKKEIYKNIKITIITPSEWLNKIIKKSILKNQSIKTMPNGINTKIFFPQQKKTLRKKLKLPLYKKIILFVAQGGTDDPRKGWQYAKRIMNLYKQNTLVHFVFIGGSTYQNRTVKNNTTYVPFIKNKKTLSKYYSASDSLLLTSTAENCPLVVLEAMSCGLPIVSFNVGGVGEIIKHKTNGYLAKYLNKKDLANGVKYIINLSKKQRKRISQKNRLKSLKYYSIKSMVDKYEKLYQSI